MSFSKKVFLCFTALLLQMFCTINTAPAQTTLPAEDIAENALAATVYLEMKDKNGKTLGIGSGFFVKPNLIATNYHVIEGAAKGTAKLVGKYITYNIEGVTATDKTNDLALLKVTAYGVKPLSLGDSDAVRIGATVYVAGNPKGLEGTFSDGIISSRRDTLTKERLQMTAPISPGSSGGPVLNRKGEVIGVSFMTLQGGQNLNFAIPSKYLKKLMEQSKPAKPLSQGIQSISAETYFMWGNAKYELDDYVGAIADYTRAIGLKSNYVEAYGNRGIARSELGQYYAAIADYNIVIRLKPNDAKAYNNRGIAKDYMGKHFAAIADYDKAVQIKKDFAIAYYNRGNAKSNLEQYFVAITDYDKAIQIKRDYVEAYVNRGVAKGNLGQYVAAIVDLDSAIQLNPNDAVAYVKRGNAKYNLGQHFTAIIDYDKAIQIKPNYIEAYTNRGKVKSLAGQHFAAIADFDRAIQLKPDYAETYYYRATVKFDLEKYFAAITDYDKAIQLKPGYADAYADRGVAKANLGRDREAKQDLRTALKLAVQTGNTNLKARIEETLPLLE